MRQRSDIQYKINRTFVVHFLLISITTVLGIWATAYVTEHVLMKEALVKEAAYFWTLYDENPQHPRPDTRNLLGLLREPQGGDVIPPQLQHQQPGFRRIQLKGKQPLVYIQDRGDKRLYLIFDESSVSRLALLFGVLPLAFVLLVIYLASFLVWRRSRKLLSPLVRLATLLKNTSINGGQSERPDWSVVQAADDSEVGTLLQALDDYANRLVEYVERERMFTRDASHELRTPLAVIRANLELLRVKQGNATELNRISDTLDDMAAVIETLLVLARNEHEKIPKEDLIVNDLVANLIERLAPLVAGKQLQLALVQQSLLKVHGAEALLTIVLTNLLRNAINYSGSSRVDVIVGENSLTVSDHGSGMAPGQIDQMLQPYQRGGSGETGHGLGLSIVQRVCEQCGWQLRFASASGEGTQAAIIFLKPEC